MAVLQFALQHILYPSVLLFLLVGSVFAFAVGAGLVLRARAVFGLFGSLNRWVSMREAFRPLERPRSFEQTLRRQRRRLLGAVFIAASAYTIAILTLNFDIAGVTSVFGRRFSPELVGLLATILKWMLLVCNALALAVGLALVLVPDAMARLEFRLNQWYSPRLVSRSMDAMHTAPDQWVRAYPRAAGWIMMALSVFVVLNLGVIVFSRQ